MANGVNVPKPGEWPGAVESYKLVKDFVKPKIWDFITVFGLGFVIVLVFEVIFSAAFKHNTFEGTTLNDIVSLLVGAFIQIVVISIYFSVLRDKEYELKDLISHASNILLRMVGLVLVLYVVIIASLVFFIVPFFFVLPRVCLAPYFFIYGDLKVGEAIAASWHSTKGHSKSIYGILIINVALALLFITIIGIPFAIYFGIINSGSLALFVLYLSQPKKTKKLATKTSKA